MSTIFMISGAALLTVVLAATLKPHAPGIALLLSVAAGGLIIAAACTEAGRWIQRFRAVMERGGLDPALYLPVMKAVGVAAIVRITGALCRDAGQGAVAAQVELAGALVALALCFPLFERILTLAAGWMF